MFRIIWQLVYVSYALVTFVVSVLAAFPVFFLIGLANNRRARSMIWTIIHYWARCWLWVIGMPVRVSGPKPPPGRYIIVANHISYLDALVIFPAISDYFRPLGKKEMARIPLFGFIYKQIALLVDRSSQHSRTKSMRLMYRTLKHEANIVIFPEGTFNETGAPLKSFYDGAFRLAINAQTPILPVIFPDTEDRWHYSGWWKASPGRNRAVYLEPVQAAGLTAEDLPRLKQEVFSLMEAAMIELKRS